MNQMNTSSNNSNNSNNSSPIRITAIVNRKNAVNQRSNQNKEWIRDIERSYNIKLSDNIAADIFFAQHSLAVNVLEEDSLSAQNEKFQLDRCTEAQRSFRNSLVICVGLSTPQVENVQRYVPFGNMRFLHCRSSREVFTLIKKYLELNSDTQKSRLQDEYFEETRNALFYNDTAKSLCRCFLVDDLKIDDSEAQLLMEGFPSILQLLAATRSVLEDASPVDIDTINKLTSFTCPELFLAPPTSSSPSKKRDYDDKLSPNINATTSSSPVTAPRKIAPGHSRASAGSNSIKATDITGNSLLFRGASASSSYSSSATSSKIITTQPSHNNNNSNNEKFFEHF